MEIYDYDDYRVFLKSAFLRLKEKSSIHSYTRIARKVGCSASFLKKLFALKTHLGLKYATRLCHVLDLSDSERQYLYFWVLHELSDEPEVKSHLRFVLSVLKHRGQTGIPSPRGEDEKSAARLEIESKNLGTHLSLEMSRIYGRPAREEDLQRDLVPKLLDFCDPMGACATAEKLLRESQPGVPTPVHRTQSGPTSEIALDGMETLRTLTALSSNLVGDLHHFGPFTVYTGLSALSTENGLKALEILRRARSEIIALNESEESPQRIMAVQIQGYFLTKKNDLEK